MEPFKTLVSPLVPEPARDRDLKTEDFSTKPDVIVQVAARVVEQERGLELQVNPPEFTFATMLPIVSVIEAAMALKTELFSARLEAKVREPLSDLNTELFSAKLEAKASEPVMDLNSEVFSVRLEAKDSEPVKALARPLVSDPARDSDPDRDLSSDDFSTRLVAEVSDPLRL